MRDCFYFNSVWTGSYSEELSIRDMRSHNFCCIPQLGDYLSIFYEYLVIKNKPCRPFLGTAVKGGFLELAPRGRDVIVREL